MCKEITGGRNGKKLTVKNANRFDPYTLNRFSLDNKTVLGVKVLVR